MESKGHFSNVDYFYVSTKIIFLYFIIFDLLDNPKLFENLFLNFIDDESIANNRFGYEFYLARHLYRLIYSLAGPSIRMD